MIHHNLDSFYDIYNKWINKWTYSKTNSLHLIDFYKSFWYLLRIDLKHSSIISFASSLIMISMSSLFEYITRSLSYSALEETKVDFSMCQVFYDMRLFMIYFKFGLILPPLLLLYSI